MVAIGPVAGIEDVILAEDIPKGVEPVLDKVWRDGRALLAAGKSYFRKLDEDVFVLRQMP